MSALRAVLLPRVKTACLSYPAVLYLAGSVSRMLHTSTKLARTTCALMARSIDMFQHSTRYYHYRVRGGLYERDNFDRR